MASTPAVTTAELRLMAERVARADRITAAAKDETDAILLGSWLATVGADMDGKITVWNVTAEKLFGWSAAEAIGQSIAQLLVPERYRAHHLEGVHRFRATGSARGYALQRMMTPALHKDGREIIVEMTIHILATDPPSSAALFRDPAWVVPHIDTILAEAHEKHG